MSNRHLAYKPSCMPEPDVLEALLDSCRRNRRKAIIPPKPEKIYFDADRFRWYFRDRDRKTLQQWRDFIDGEMRKEEPTNDST